MLKIENTIVINDTSAVINEIFLSSLVEEMIKLTIKPIAGIMIK